MNKVVFISGHTDLTNNEFITHYKPKLDEAIKNNYHFVIGDSLGADKMAFDYLISHNCEDKITVYCIYDSPYNKVKAKKIKNKLKSHNKKDKTMTKESDFDIAYIRSISEQKRIYGENYKFRISGTERNIRRRLKLNKS